MKNIISFDKATSTFKIQTNDSTYAITISKRGYLAHSWYAKHLGDDDISVYLRQYEYGFSNNEIFREKHSLLDMLSQEYPTEGIGDYRESALSVSDSENRNAIELKYKDYSIIQGTVSVPDLPCVFADKNEAQTLQINLEDPILNVQVSLFYTAFSDTNAIVRWAKISNKNQTKNDKNYVYINKALSLSFDMDNDNYEMITLHGSWARERHIDRHAIHMGLQGVQSNRGVSSHQEHPFMAILENRADYNQGCVWGFNFIYSGNFTAQIQQNQFNSLRVQMGINPQNFRWKLEAGEDFYTPQAVMTFSPNGLNGMSQSFHNLYKNHLIRSPYKNKMRPILINNWEATYFNFDTEKLLDIARQAHKDGIEMLVMDDGWFGHRSFDDSSLGDWIVNEEKLKGGLKYLVDEVNKLGMKFGIWFEPEMISPDSYLFKQHPDWAIQIQGRDPGMSRQQLVLDITRDEVRNHTYNSIKAILNQANIEYVKWDMNRQLSDIASLSLDKEHIGEYFHRYVIALYKMQEQLTKDFPDLLLENCSGGGARFDAGMLYYSPQVWCSDDTDAIERLSIQEGTALMYPLSTMGAHVSVCPNHTVGRVTPFKTRGYVALSGTFGYELDITKLSDEDRKIIPTQIALYKKFNDLIRDGVYWRIASYSENNEYDCWMSVKDDKKEALVTFIQVLNHPNYKTRFIKLKGLNEDSIYSITYPDEDPKDFPPSKLSGKTLMNAGLPVSRPWADFQGKLIYLKEEK